MAVLPLSSRTVWLPLIVWLLSRLIPLGTGVEVAFCDVKEAKGRDLEQELKTCDSDAIFAHSVMDKSLITFYQQEHPHLQV